MRFMVTGATGFLGANLVVELAKEGHQVLALDRTDPPESLREEVLEEKGQVTWQSMDVSRRSQWDQLRGREAEVLVHAAAVTPADEGDPVATVDVNLRGSLLALEHAIKEGFDRVITLSSASVYRDVPPGPPLSEDLPLRPLHGYGVSKIAVETFTSLYREQKGLDCFSVRLSSIYGPWERPTGARTRMSPVFHLAVAAASGHPLTVLPQGGGLCDWTEVGDAARGLSHLARVPRVPFDIINLSRGQPHEIGEVVSALSELVPGSSLRLLETSQASQDPDLVVPPTRQGRPLEVERLRSLGFECGTSLPEGLARYLDWLKKGRNLEMVR